MKKYIFCVLVLSPWFLSCTSMQNTQPKPNIQKNTRSAQEKDYTYKWKVREEIKKYDCWETREFKYIGLKVDVPKEAETTSSVIGHPYVCITFHYIRQPFWVPLDAIIFVHIYINRIPLGKLKQELESTKRSNLFKNSTKEKNAYWFWRFKFQKETSRWEEPGNYTYYRRDIKINDTEILHAYAEVLNAGCKENIHADHAAVRRILDSIEPLHPEK